MYASPWSSDMPRSLRSEEHTSELQSLRHLVCRLLLEKKKEEELLGRMAEQVGKRLWAVSYIDDRWTVVDEPGSDVERCRHTRQSHAPSSGMVAGRQSI